MVDQKLNPLIIALDVPSEEQAIQIVEEIDAPDLFVKVGLQLFSIAGPSLIKRLVERKISVFLDLKLHDIPNTVRQAASALASLGVHMLTVHCAGGSAMLKAAREGIEEARQGKDAPLLVGVTHLTSTSQQMLNDEIGVSGSLQQAVDRYAHLAKQSGLDGVVCSLKEVRGIKEVCGSSFLTVTPGIRPTGSDQHDQVRVGTPRQARLMGSDYLVVGRPITQAAHRRLAYDQIMTEIREGDQLDK